MSLVDDLLQLEQQAQQESEVISSSEDLERLRLKYLSRKGLLAQLTSELRTVEPAERPRAGQEANRIKQTLVQLFETKSKALGQAAAASGARPKEDLTMPGTAKQIGGLHPVTQVTDEICDIFSALGFEMVSGPEMETEYHNFEALNIPPDHPSRDNLDTFYLANGKLLRSQTSTVQIRVMEKRKPPLKIIAPGRVYRPDATDANHSFMFHQIEGLMVDDQVSFAELKGFAEALTTFGQIGVKVWIYKGDILPGEKQTQGSNRKPSSGGGRK